MFNTNVKEISKELLIYAAILFILLLTSININDFLAPKNVLGIKSSKETSYQEFWGNFLSENPNYIPGLIETGQTDKASRVDPNYIIP